MRRSTFALIVTFTALAPSRSGAQPIGPEFQVNTYTTGNQAVPRVATDGAGSFVVVWSFSTQDGSGYGVFGQRYASAGDPAGAEFRVNTYTTGNQEFPGVAVDGGGSFVIVWESRGQDGSYRGVFGQRYGSSGSPVGPEFRVNTYTSSYQGYPSVAADGAGDFVVVWTSNAQDGSLYSVHGQRYASSGAPAGSEFRVNTYTTNSQRFPSVAATGVGGFVVVWQSPVQDAGTSGIFGQRYASSGAPAGPEFRVNTYTTANQYSASVGASSTGDFVVVWRSEGQDGSGFAIIAQRYASSGAPAGPEFLVNTYTTNFQVSPAVAVDGAGSFVVAWVSYSAMGSPLSADVFGQRYASSGAPAGTQFRVNTYTTDAQRYPSVAADGTGDFVVVWTSNKQDGSAYAVIGQRFCPPLASVTISVNGTTSVCPTGTGGTATVSDSGGGPRTHQWAWRPMGGMSYTPIGGAIGTTYQIHGTDFSLGAPGFYELACSTNPQCGVLTFSNFVSVIVSTDGTPPMVTPPAASTVTQTLCQ